MSSSIPQESQTIVLAIVASIVVWSINLYVKHRQKKESPLTVADGLGRGPATLLLFVPVLILAFVFQPQTLPTFPVVSFDDVGTSTASVLDWLVLLIAAVKGLIGYAVVIYNLVLKKVMDTLAANGSGIGQAIKDAFSD